MAVADIAADQGNRLVRLGHPVVDAAVEPGLDNHLEEDIVPVVADHHNLADPVEGSLEVAHRDSHRLAEEDLRNLVDLVVVLRILLAAGHNLAAGHSPVGEDHRSHQGQDD